LTPFWEQPLGLWDRLHAVGLRSHYVASVFAARLMVGQGRGLIVNISSSGAGRHLFNVAYGVAKAGVEKLTSDTAEELRPHGVAVVSLWPPFTATEIVLGQAERWSPASLRTAASPQLTGRAVAALAGDSRVMDKSGRRLVVAALAEEYGFTDVDGARPPIPEYARQGG
jgi:dehydrogenase/reductase SDR family protein 1